VKLGWSPKVGFEELVKEMVASDLVEIDRESWRRDRSAR
jgi:GDP-D-mannose dehydratase